MRLGHSDSEDQPLGDEGGVDLVNVGMKTKVCSHMMMVHLLRKNLRTWKRKVLLLLASVRLD